MNDPWSARDPRFRAAIARWLATSSDLLLLRRRPGATANRDWFVVRSLTDLDLVLGRSRAADCLSAFADPQLVTRGRADEELLDEALALLASGEECVFGVVVDLDPALQDAVSAFAGDEDRVATWFTTHRGSPIACGRYPPFLSDDLSVVVEGIVPMDNGSIARGVY